MRKMVILAALLVVATGFAAQKVAVPKIGVASSQLSAVAPGHTYTPDPAFADIRAQQAELRARGDLAGVKMLENQIQEILLKRQPGQADVGQPVWLPEPPKMSQSFTPDQLILGGGITSFATDYEQDAFGTMWTAVAWYDSTIRVFKSEDHGASWPYVTGFFWNPKHPIGKMEMAVGFGDSNFVYIWEVVPANDGDLLVARINQDGSNLLGWGVLAGADTITDFAACKDNVAPYYLYTVAYNGGQEGATDWPVSTWCRSTDYAKTWAIVDTTRNAHHPRLRFGAGSHLYQGAAPAVAAYDQVAQAVINTSYLSPDMWVFDDVVLDTFRVWDAVLCPAFTYPDSEAVTWIVFSHNYEGTVDWDVHYAWTSDRMVNWSAIGTIAYTTAIEAYVDLKNYTNPGNTYVNASYCITGDNTNYITWAEAGSPDAWATETQVNQTVGSGWSYELTPQVIYSPFGPGTGGGLVFADNIGDGVYFNAPWFIGVEEQRAVKPLDFGLRVLPSPASGPVQVSWRGNASRVQVCDRTGRAVADLAPAGSSARWDGKVAAGTYFVRVTTDRGTATKSVVVQ